jgi:hypothetical protein
MSMVKSMVANQMMSFIRLADDGTIWREMTKLKSTLAKSSNPKHKRRVASLLGMYVGEAARRGITGPCKVVTCDETGFKYRT